MSFSTKRKPEPEKGCIISKNILSGSALRWAVRENPNNALDSGWFFISEDDTDEFFDDPRNCCVAHLDVVAKIEPAIVLLRDCPIGTDVVLIEEDGEAHFYDSESGELVV